MNPVLVHADGTDCQHTGQIQATMLDEGGPLCPGGLPVTHVRFNGRVLTIDEAYTAFNGLARSLAAAITPLVAAFAEFFRHVSADPAIRALAAAAEVVTDERRREGWNTEGAPRNS